MFEILNVFFHLMLILVRELIGWYDKKIYHYFCNSHPFISSNGMKYCSAFEFCIYHPFIVDKPWFGPVEK